MPTRLDRSIDVVVATVGRTDEPARLFESIAAQRAGTVRIIVVDQNDDDRLTPALRTLPQRIDVLHLRSRRGLSRARNAALQHLRGHVVTFADDDCWYPSDLFECIFARLDARADLDALIAKSIDAMGAPSNARWDNTSGTIDRQNVWRRAISYTIFLRRHVVEAVGPFDEELGVGAGTDFGSGEETDYLLRALDCGFTLWYDPSLAVLHPQSRQIYDAAAIAAGRRYGMGFGRVLRKHRYPVSTAAYYVGRAVGGSALSLIKGNRGAARFHLAVARGRLSGWRHR